MWLCVGLESFGEDRSAAAATTMTSGLTAASKLSAAMQSLGAGTGTDSDSVSQSQHHVEEHRQQHQSTDGSTSMSAAAR